MGRTHLLHSGTQNITCRHTHVRDTIFSVGSELQVGATKKVAPERMQGLLHGQLALRVYLPYAVRASAPPWRDDRWQTKPLNASCIVESPRYSQE